MEFEGDWSYDWCVKSWKIMGAGFYTIDIALKGIKMLKIYNSSIACNIYCIKRMLAT